MNSARTPGKMKKRATESTKRKPVCFPDAVCSAISVAGIFLLLSFDKP